MFYPVIFKPIYKEMIWGGDRLNRVFERTLPSGKIGESWDISCRPAEMGIIENGSWAGKSFAEYIEENRTGVLGTRLADTERFPLLVKLIDANDSLSIQVHPDDIFARQKGSADSGKSEMWYVLVPPDDGHLIIGLNSGVTREVLAQAYENGTVEQCLYRLPVKTGDIINIPAGLVHALTSGVMVAEVQQNSDLTYRLYDYNRLGLDGQPRPLHVDDALTVTDFSGKIPKNAVSGLNIKKDGNELIYAICNPYFAIIKYVLSDSLNENSDPAAFSIFTCVEGKAVIEMPTLTAELLTGRSVFIPAGMGAYNIKPADDNGAVLLKSFVPDITKDFFDPLYAAGFSREDIQAHTALS